MASSHCKWASPSTVLWLRRHHRGPLQPSSGCQLPSFPGTLIRRLASAPVLLCCLSDPIAAPPSVSRQLDVSSLRGRARRSEDHRRISGLRPGHSHPTSTEANWVVSRLLSRTDPTNSFKNRRGLAPAFPRHTLDPLAPRCKPSKGLPFVDSHLDCPRLHVQMHCTGTSPAHQSNVVDAQ